MWSPNLLTLEDWDYRYTVFCNLQHVKNASAGCVTHRLRPCKPWAVMRHPTNIWITAVDKGRGGGISSPRRWRGNWDIIQTKRPLTQASVSVYVREVRVSIPFRLTSVIYSLPTRGWGYFDESHEDRTNIQYKIGALGAKVGNNKVLYPNYSLHYIWFNSSIDMYQPVGWERLTKFRRTLRERE